MVLIVVVARRARMIDGEDGRGYAFGLAAMMVLL